MRLLNLSATRSVNPNLRNQKAATKNPSFGSTLQYNNAVLSTNANERKAEETNLKAIQENIGKCYPDYNHKLSLGIDDELMIDGSIYLRGEHGAEIRQSALKDESCVKPISDFITNIDELKSLGKL